MQGCKINFGSSLRILMCYKIKFILWRKLSSLLFIATYNIIHCIDKKSRQCLFYYVCL